MEQEQTTICSNCKRDIPVVNYTTHWVHCARNIGVCPVCKEAVPHSELDNHYQSLHKLLPCKACGERVCGSDLADHVRDSCAHTELSCRYCELRLPRRELPAHAAYCGARTERCGVCNTYVMTRHRQQHLDSGHVLYTTGLEAPPEIPKGRGIFDMSGRTNSYINIRNARTAGAPIRSQEEFANVIHQIIEQARPLRRAPPRNQRHSESARNVPQDLPLDTNDENVRNADFRRPRSAALRRPLPNLYQPGDLALWQNARQSHRGFVVEENRNADPAEAPGDSGVPPVPPSPLRSAAVDLGSNQRVEARRLKVNNEERGGEQAATSSQYGTRPNAEFLGKCLPMSEEQFAKKIRELKLNNRDSDDDSDSGHEDARGHTDLADDNSNMNDRFSEIKSELRRLRRGLNEVTAPYNVPPTTPPRTPTPEGAMAGEIRLPCEFCDQLQVPEDLVRHQSECGQPPSQQYEEATGLSPPEECDAVIPCEFCTESLPVHLFNEHQLRCQPDM